MSAIGLIALLVFGPPVLVAMWIAIFVAIIDAPSILRRLATLVRRSRP